MLALTALSPGWVAFFFIVALVIFLIAAFIGWRTAPAAGQPADGRPVRVLWRVNLIALGLAVYMFVLAWQALASTK